MSTLDNKVAIVTGASSGIGAQTARQLSAQGAHVALVARRADRLESLAAELNGHTLVLPADLTDATAAQKVVDDVIAEWGQIDILVNAAGVMLNGDSIESPLSEWDAMIDVNLRGLLYISKAALPHLKASAGERGIADLVNVSSVGGRIASPGVAAYSATKFGVTAFSESLRSEFAKDHLRVSVVEPGRTDTELFEQKEGQAAGFEAMFGQIEQLQPSDIANVIEYIVSAPKNVAVNEVVIRPTEQN